MKTSKFLIVLYILCAALAAGCVKEEMEDCPDPAPPTPKKVMVAVRDKNYDNADEALGSLRAETLPIREYIETLFRIHPTREEILTPDELVHVMANDQFVDGANRLELFGHAFESDMDDSRVVLHPDGAEGKDIYVGADTITMPLPEDRTVWMLRAKGRLIVDVEGVPDSVATVAISVGGIRQQVGLAFDDLSSDDSRLVYAGQGTVSKLWHTAALEGMGPYDMLLAPSVAAGESQMVIEFKDSRGQLITSVAAKIDIRRNHITRLKATYNARNWVIIVLVNGSWRQLDSMSIDEDAAGGA